jgi:transcriptional regulator with XRE-family HTH domain
VVQLDRAQFDYELARRNLTARELSRLTGIPEPTISKARHGRRVRPGTLQRLSSALARQPITASVDIVLRPDKTNAAASTSAASKEVVDGALNTDDAPGTV